MSTVVRRHQKDTKTFEELTAKEQALSINAHTGWYLKAAALMDGKLAYTKPQKKLPVSLNEWQRKFGISSVPT